MSAPRRAVVVDPETQAVINVILVDPAAPIELPGRLIVEDEWGAGPGDAWDPAQQRPYRPVAEIETGGEPVIVLADQQRAILESRRGDLEAALLRGDIEAAMSIVLQVDRALRELQAAVGPREAQ